jgi:hypothetical protein
MQYGTYSMEGSVQSFLEHKPKPKGSVGVSEVRIPEASEAYRWKGGR